MEQQKKYHEFEKNINLPGSAIATANKASKKIEKILEFIFVGIVMKQSIVFWSLLRCGVVYIYQIQSIQIKHSKLFYNFFHIKNNNLSYHFSHTIVGYDENVIHRKNLRKYLLICIKLIWKVKKNITFPTKLNNYKESSPINTCYFSRHFFVSVFSQWNENDWMLKICNSQTFSMFTSKIKKIFKWIPSEMLILANIFQINW